MSQGPNPRAVSAASPARSSFFDRESRGPSVYGGRDPEGRASKSISSSRLSQMLPSEPNDEVTTKAKGFKGLLLKIKSNGGPKSSDPSIRADRRSSAAEDQISHIGTPLAPPRQMSSHNDRDDMIRDRGRGKSTPYKQADLPGTTAGRYGSFPPGLRSAPFLQGASTSNKYQNAIGTSSDLPHPAPQRESYASVLTRDKRQSWTRQSGSTDRRGSEMEMLSAGRVNTSPEASSVFDEPLVTPRGAGAAVPTHVTSQLATYPPAALRPHNKTTSSLSASSFVETPPPVPVDAPFFDQRNPGDDVIKAGPASLSPNRLKSLPPLPVVRRDDVGSSDSFAAVFLGKTDSAPSGQNHDRQPIQIKRLLADSPKSGFVHRHRNKEPSYQQPRASFDQAGDFSSIRQGPLQPRMAQSLYLQPEGAGSTGNFGRFMAIVGKRQESGTGIDLSDGRSLTSQKGFKGLLSRAGKVVK